MSNAFRLVSLAFVTACTVYAEPEALEDLDAQSIVGGSNAAVGEFPYQVSIQDRWGHFCGGSLIGQEWVLTAAHCVEGVRARGLRVVAGAHRLSEGGETFTVASVLMHPDWDNHNLDSDMALLRLSRPASNHPTIALTDTSNEARFAAPGALATVTGWGALYEGGPSPDVLQKVQVPVIDHATCGDAYLFDDITDRMMCAGYLGTGGRDACQGDSGGPMVVAANGELAQAGVVSWGHGCADPNYPGIYARVSAFESWIRSYVPDARFLRDDAPAPAPSPTATDDHGDTAETATWITLDVTHGSATANLSGTIGAGGDQDWFILDIRDSYTPLAVDFIATTTGATDTYAWLFDANGDLVTHDDDSGDATNFRIERFLKPGLYTLVVHGYDDTTSGAYALSVQALW